MISARGPDSTSADEPSIVGSNRTCETFRRPPVSQFPYGLPTGFARYENMPQGAERRALQKRSAWIASHLGDVSQTFSNLAVTAADLTSLLRKIEADQTLVHAAYYTNDECIARIADWIAGRV
jgi:hypothetical protein